jgi:hypothetical protein
LNQKETVQALSLAKECYSMKLDLLTNATVVDDAIRFVSQKSIGNAESTDGSSELSLLLKRQLVAAMKGRPVNFSIFLHITVQVLIKI